MTQAKPFNITKQEVWEAYKKVRSNKGAPGIDEQSIEDFESNLKGNLYALWNRMSSGSYFSLPVKRVEIPKPDGRMRPLGVPTVRDRIAQMVVKQRMEPELERIFHANSYGYRPGKSAHDALGRTRRRCWDYDWVLELDIKGFFDNIDHELLMKAVEKHVKERWCRLYISRWLRTAVQLPDGTEICSAKGTPQGGVISPLLANLFLHYAFDKWMDRNYPSVPFERYADDGVCHCKTEAEAVEIRNAMVDRFLEVGLELHPAKTKIVYCKDDDRTGEYPETSFDFLGYTFRPRRSKNRWGKYFINFSPAISNKALKTIRREMRSWGLQNRSDKSLNDLARMFNPKIQGWINYYGRFYKSAMYPALRHLDRRLSWWAVRKYKKLRNHKRRSRQWLAEVAKRDPKLFAHWALMMRKG
jgi:group II intron reverse transcriptase/maturase